MREGGAPWNERGPSPFLHLYLALLVHVELFLYAVYGRRPEAAAWLYALMGAAGALTAVAGLSRILLLDYMRTFGPWGWVGYSLVLAASFVAPAALAPGHVVLPEGFATGLLPILLFAVSGAAIRALAGFLIVGFWMLGGTAQAPGLGLTIAFGATTLWALAAAHFAFTGEAFGLGGWWSARRVWLTAMMYLAPSALAGWLAFEFWPQALPEAPEQAAVERKPMAVRVAEADVEELMEALRALAIWMGALLLCLVGLYYARRLLGRNRKPVSLPQLRATDVSELRVSEEQEGLGGPRIGGRRGRVIKLWHRWARLIEERGLARGPGETAAELARRAEREGLAPPEAMTRLFERAHYGPVEPTADEVEQMRAMVEAAKAKGG